MTLPEPVPGLVICYAYLWRDEALRGQEEGRKDRPAVIVLAVENARGRTEIVVAPVTHSPPERAELAVELPPATRKRLGLDDQRSWVVAADLNRFVWPGADLRPIRKGAGTFVFGLLPAALYREIRDKAVELARKGKAAMTTRTE